MRGNGNNNNNATRWHLPEHDGFGVR